MKLQNYFISICVITILYCSSLFSQNDLTAFPSKVAEIYKGNIEDAADYIAHFPSDAEADEILNNFSFKGN